MKTAFVTGGTGFLGRNLIEALLANGGWRVIALHRAGADTSGLQGRVELVEGDITDAASLAAAIPQGCDCVFHCAADTTLWKPAEARQYEINVGGTRNIVEACLAQGAKRLVHVSSQAAYAHHEGTIDETAAQLGDEAADGYSRSKFLAEQEVRKGIERGLAAVIINPAHILGPYDDGNWSRMIRMVHEEKLPGVPSGAGTFGDAREIARAMIAAAEQGRTGENYFTGGVDASFLEVITIIGRLTGKKVPKKPLPDFAIRLIARLKDIVSRLTGKEPDVTPAAAEHVIGHYFVDSSKAERELGFRATPLETLLADTHAWMKAEGLLD
jgi:nucleoside-diphosphate-sugar epimerase